MGAADRKGVRLDVVQKQSLSESVYRQLEQRIVAKEIAPGDALPSERLLSEMLGVNRGAVREGIKRLQQSGLVAVRQGGNHVVLDYQQEAGLELLPTLMVDSKGAVNASVVRSIMSLRSLMASAVAAAAAENGGAGLAGKLDAVLEQMRAAEKDAARLQELVLGYWDLLVEASDNIAFRLAFNSMNRTYRSAWVVLRMILEPEFRDFDNLQALADAVRVRDADKARDCAADHVAIGAREMEKKLRGSRRA